LGRGLALAGPATGVRRRVGGWPRGDELYLAATPGAVRDSAGSTNAAVTRRFLGARRQPRVREALTTPAVVRGGSCSGAARALSVDGPDQSQRPDPDSVSALGQAHDARVPLADLGSRAAFIRSGNTTFDGSPKLGCRSLRARRGAAHSTARVLRGLVRMRSQVLAQSANSREAALSRRVRPRGGGAAFLAGG